MKKKTLLTLLLATGAIGLGYTQNQAKAESVEKDVFRLYNPNTGQHFYTTNPKETTNLMDIGWKFEGSEWNIEKTKDADPIYRLYNPNTGDHFYTLSKKEQKDLVKAGWNDEGVEFYQTDKEVKVLRAYNPNASVGTHHYTKDVNEKNALVKAGWKDEKVAWYGINVEDKTDKQELNSLYKKAKNKSVNTQLINETEVMLASKTITQKEVDRQERKLKEALNIKDPSKDDTTNDEIAKDQELSQEEYMNQLTKHLYNEVNSIRKEKGLKEVVYKDEFQKYADIRAEELYSRDDGIRPDTTSFETVMPEMYQANTDEVRIQTAFPKEGLTQEIAKSEGRFLAEAVTSADGTKNEMLVDLKDKSPWIAIGSHKGRGRVILIDILIEK